MDDLSLEVKAGDRIGLVGHNGSGKTTLLRILSGIYKPSGGRIEINGSVGTLLNPNAGMDPESTGTENIYLRGYVLGLTKKQIEDQIEDISEFSQLGDFLQLPVKTYSAGMAARLAFAISTAAHNDILLIDEGIGAGDATFVKRAQQRIDDLINRTSIVMLASHSESIIESLCNRRISMSHGKIIEDVRFNG
ncbi:ABC transporter ATP-binding protein [Devosia sp. SL43]|uniref:ABC transporter ATP-binding protein n=1 Tax=Devosia sp. SL43 TaxID=2806348 RepID=UPI003FA4657A